MKLGTKLITVISTVNLVSICILTVSALLFSRSQISTLVYGNVKTTAEKSATRLEAWIVTYLDDVRTIAQIMSHYDLIAPDERRPYFNSILQSETAENSSVLGAWANFEPNTLDGQDDRYVNTPGSDSTGRFLSYFSRVDGEVKISALVDYNNSGPAGDYYRISFTTGHEALLEPYYYNVGGVDTLITSLTAPIIFQGKTIGVVGIDLALPEIQSLVMEIKAFENGSAAVFSSKGTIIAHSSEPARVGRDLRETETDIAGKYIDGFYQAVISGKDYSFVNYLAQAKSRMIVHSTPFAPGSVDTPWTVAIGVPEKSVMQAVYRMTVVFIILGVVMLLAMSIVVFIFARSITTPLKNMQEKFTFIGAGDFTHQIEIAGKDELSDIGRSFNQTLENIKNLILVIQEKSSILSEVGVELSSNMNETASAINEITANTQSIKEQITTQAAIVASANTKVDEITGNIGKLNGHIEQQGASVSRSSSAIEQMLANIQSVTRTLVENAENVRNLLEAAAAGSAGLQEVSGDIQRIAHESEGLLEINAVMENIASQTNLLSMNAAIEAAHAGEAGKGFAVVAGEIRKLAENSSSQSKTISEVLKKITESIVKIQKSTGTVLSEFQTIDRGVQTVVQQEEHIRHAMVEQGEGSKQILETIAQLNDITRQVRTGAELMLADSEAVSHEGGNLQMQSQQILGGITEMSTGANEINVAVSRVNELSGKNQESIETLAVEVSRFKVA